MRSIAMCKDCLEVVKSYGEPACELFGKVCQCRLYAEMPYPVEKESAEIETLRFLELKGLICTTEDGTGEGLLALPRNALLLPDVPNRGDTCLVLPHIAEALQDGELE